MNITFVELTVSGYEYWKRSLPWEAKFDSWEALYKEGTKRGLILVLEESNNAMSHRFAKVDTSIRRLHLLDSDKFVVHPHSTYVMKTRLLAISKVI